MKDSADRSPAHAPATGRRAGARSARYQIIPARAALYAAWLALIGLLIGELFVRHWPASQTADHNHTAAQRP